MECWRWPKQLQVQGEGLLVPQGCLEACSQNQFLNIGRHSMSFESFESFESSESFESFESFELFDLVQLSVCDM